jgi:HSP20 family molecular chaperone IbpA
MNSADPRNWMWSEACAMLERAERLHRQFFQPGPAETAAWEPPIDVFETGSEVRVVAALPGVEPRDLKVFVGNGELVIAGTRRPPALAQEAVIHRLEVPYGRFERRIPISAALELTRSELVSGCLTLSLAKRR